MGYVSRDTSPIIGPKWICLRNMAKGICLLFLFWKRIRDCIIFQICTYIELTKPWNRGLIWSVTNKTIIHLHGSWSCLWWLKRLIWVWDCVVWLLKKWPKYLRWHEFLRIGGGYTLAAKTPLSMTRTIYQWLLGLFMKFVVCSIFQL